MVCSLKHSFVIIFSLVDSGGQSLFQDIFVCVHLRYPLPINSMTPGKLLCLHTIPYVFQLQIKRNSLILEHFRIPPFPQTPIDDCHRFRPFRPKTRVSFEFQLFQEAICKFAEKKLMSNCGGRKEFHTSFDAI